MRDPKCPGCWRDRGADICCDPCWARLPAKLPIGPGGEMRAWRRRNLACRRQGGHYDWMEVERIMIQVREWLAEHHERVETRT